MSVFGNGVIDGWEVSATEAFTVSISQGYGNINFIAGRTDFPDTIVDLPPSTIQYVYAKINQETTFSENIEFVLSTTQNVTDPNFLLLAQVVTGPIAIEAIDNSIRQNITFIELIKAAIRNHKHRGGSLNPSKIDLASEVKGQLPSFRIADFDAEKVTTGTFDLARMPLFDHQELQNVGLLTHPQLDTFVKNLETSNKELFGEIHTANLLQLILATKFIYDDPESALYFPDRDVDQFMYNEISLIPGITPNELIDFDNTTSEVNLEEHYIKGIAPKTGTSFYVNFDKALAFQNAHIFENLAIISDSVTLAFNDADETNILTVEGFESSAAPDEDLSDGDPFSKQTLIIDDQAFIKSNASSTNVIEGFYSGKFSHQQKFRSTFTKTFATAQDWSTYDTFVMHVKCLDQIHGPVKMFFTSNSGEQSVEYIVLEQDEVTDNPDPGSNNFEVRTIDLATVPFSNDIKTITFYSDDLENPFSFFIDFMNVQRAVLLPPSGKMVLRYSAGVQVTFSQIEFDTTEPPDTLVTVRARAASGTALLTRAEWTPFLNTGDLINLEGSDIEIEIVLFADGDRITSPLFNSARILVLTESEIDGFSINTATEFARGEANNVTINDSNNTLALTTPIYVDSYYFNLGNSINQIVENKSQGTPFVEAELGIFGQNSPISPNQVFATFESQETAISNAKLFGPRSVKRQFDRSYVVADTYNDRVLQFDEDGQLLAGVGSVNYTDENLYPISAAVDKRTGILYIVWSRSVSFETVNVSKITLQTASQKIQLIQNFDLILGLTQTELQQVQSEGQIMPVHLSNQNAALAQQLPESDGFMFVANDAVDTGLDTDSEIYQIIVTTLGIPLYVGNFAYIDGIFTPTWADKTDEEGWILSNGTVAVKDFEVTGVSRSTNAADIIEIDKNNNIIFGSTKMKFSPFIPGRVEVLDKNTLMIGGLRTDGEEGTPDSSHPFNFREFFGDDANKQLQKETIKQILFDGSTPFKGAVLIFDKQADASTFEYISPEGVVVSDVDLDPNTGEIIIAESSLSISGRVIKVDAFGNIVFSFGEGLYTLINDVVAQIDGSLVIST